MVAEGEDWKSVEIPADGGSVTPASNVGEEADESEQPSGGNSTVLYLYLK